MESCSPPVLVRAKTTQLEGQVREASLLSARREQGRGTEARGNRGKGEPRNRAGGTEEERRKKRERRKEKTKNKRARQIGTECTRTMERRADAAADTRQKKREVDE